MFKLFLCFSTLSQLLIGNAAHAKPDGHCEGVWSIEILKDENYTPWHAYTQNPSYPVRLEISTFKPRAAIFTDNKGRECSIGYLNDVDDEILVFKHCLKSKNPDTIPLHYKVRCTGGELFGKIATHKDLFEIRGFRFEK